MSISVQEKLRDEERFNIVVVKNQYDSVRRSRDHYWISTMKCGLNTLQIPFSRSCSVSSLDLSKSDIDVSLSRTRMWLTVLRHGHWLLKTTLGSRGHDEERHIRRLHVIGRDYYSFSSVNYVTSESIVSVMDKISDFCDKNTLVMTSLCVHELDS